MELTFLGHHIDQEGIRPLPEKIAAIRDCEVPTSLKRQRILRSRQLLSAVYSRLCEDALAANWYAG